LLCTVCRTSSSRSLELLGEGEDEDDGSIFAKVNSSGTGKMTLSEFLSFYEQTDRSAESAPLELVEKFNM
jgi:Ca2+-binding EF-hand superfamily protein